MSAFYIDNNLSVHLAPELRRYGHSATTARDQAMTAANDATQPIHAALNDWTLLTNDTDFIVLHGA